MLHPFYIKKRKIYDITIVLSVADFVLIVVIRDVGSTCFGFYVFKAVRRGEAIHHRLIA